MRARWDAKSNPWSYRIAQNFGSGLPDWRTVGGLGRQRDKNKQGAGLPACKQVLDFDVRGVERKGQEKSSSPDHWLLGLLAGDLFLGCPKFQTDPRIHQFDLQIHRSGDLPSHWSTDLTIYESTDSIDLQTYWSINLQIRRSSDLQIYWRSIDLKIYRSTVLLIYWSSDLQIHPSRNLPIHRSTDQPI